MRELFVWYRVRPDAAEAARAAVEAMQAALVADHDGLVARVLVRADVDGAAQTWMETYARPGSRDGVDPTLAARIEARATALSALIDGGRHVEAFAPVGR